MRENFWTKNVPAAAFKNMAEIARETGMHEPAVYAVKSADRPLSADNARKVAEMGGDKSQAGRLFLASQVAALKKKIATKKITDEGVLRSAGHIMATATKSFRPSETDRFDADFRKVALELKAIAEHALEMVPTGEYAEPTRATGDSVDVALKKELDAHDGKVTRDVHGRAVPQGERIERDAHGRAVRS